MRRSMVIRFCICAFVAAAWACDGSGLDGGGAGTDAMPGADAAQDAGSTGGDARAPGTDADTNIAANGGATSGGVTSTGGGGAGASGPGGGTKVTSDLALRLSVQMADAICDAKETCIGEYRLMQLSGGHPCRPDLEQRLAHGLLAGVPTSVNAGLLDYDANGMPACLDDIRALGCDVRPTRLPPSCRDALSGAVSPGDACNTNMDCVGDAFCDQGEAAICPGVCTARLSDGQPCDDDRSCEDGLICENVDDDTEFVCTAPRKAGESCRGLYDPMCELDLECFVKGPLDLYHVCKPITEVYVGGAGDPCVSSWGLLCQDDPASGDSLTCYGLTRTCGPALKSGDSCSLARSDPCPMQEYCNTTSGQCETRVGANEPCHPARPRYCAEEHACLAARVGGQSGAFCLPMATMDEDCTVSGQCYSGFCDPVSGTCQPDVVCQ